MFKIDPVALWWFDKKTKNWDISKWYVFVHGENSKYGIGEEVKALFIIVKPSITEKTLKL